MPEIQNEYQKGTSRNIFCSSCAYVIINEREKKRSELVYQWSRENEYDNFISEKKGITNKYSIQVLYHFYRIIQTLSLTRELH